jgi:glutamate racemase
LRTKLSQQPIGVFDSGVGGLSVLKVLREQLPKESFIYVADSGFAPYGDRPPAFIQERVFKIAEFLIDRDVKSIVVACNTATVTAITALRATYSIPIIGLEPAIKPSVKLSRSGIVGVLATERTINSQSVAELCNTFSSSTQFLLQPCPGLVECVENGDTSSDTVRALLQSFIEPLLAQDADVIVLGCTHYVFLIPLIRELYGSRLAIIESSAAIAQRVERKLPNTKLKDGTEGIPSTEFYTSSVNKKASDIFSKLLNETVQVHSF